MTQTNKKPQTMATKSLWHLDYLPGCSIIRIHLNDGAEAVTSHGKQLLILTEESATPANAGKSYGVLQIKTPQCTCLYICVYMLARS